MYSSIERGCWGLAKQIQRMINGTIKVRKLIREKLKCYGLEFHLRIGDRRLVEKAEILRNRSFS